MKDIALRKAIKALREVGHEPIAAYMRNKNRPPEEGWWLVLPKSCEKLHPGPFGWPAYVRISSILTLPCLVMAREGHGNPPNPAPAERKEKRGSWARGQW